LKILKKIQSIPELNFVILCSQVEPDSNQRGIIKNIADNPLNWDMVCNIAQQQRTLLLLAQTCKKLVPDKIPSTIMEKLKNFSFKNGIRNLYILNFVLNTILFFKKKNIAAIPFKGLITAQDLYGDIGLRFFSDIDLLVKKNKAREAWLLLNKKGFKPELNLNPQQIKKYIAIEDNIGFFHAKKNITLELHWEMSGIYLPNPLSFEDIENRLTNITIEKQKIKNFSSEDLLLYLCIHGAKHGWEYLEQVCSISELLKKKKELNWTLIQMLSAQWRCTNVLLLGLNLAKILFNAPVPDEMNLKITENKIIRELSESVLNNMFSNQHNSQFSLRYKRFRDFHIKIKDNFSDKTLYLARLIFRPTKKEWLYFPVGAHLSFIHYFLRPIRLITTGLAQKDA
jgi:hypothetical protein